MNKDQINAVRAAYVELTGALEDIFRPTPKNDSESYQLALRYLEEVFPDVLSDLFPVED